MATSSAAAAASGFDADKAAAKREADRIPLQTILNPEEEERRKALRENYLCQSEDPDVTPVNFIPKCLLDDRVARVHKNCKNALQSGTFNTKHWRITFAHEKRWDNPLVGWGASADSLSCLALRFETAEDAASHCERNGWRYFVEETPGRGRRKIRSYRDNFLWDKRCRASTK